MRYITRYTVQRPTTVWIEVSVEADSEQEAMDMADELFDSGDYQTLDQTYDINYSKFWIQDEDGGVRYV